ncbi:hypothetical protein [Flammeovirga sp. OC4]|uniref:hypothetical protein n=1 Tax=Flammeovirga sp. OC4 TaxID=1382345 RepID=UPI0005C729B3|nr:hypothetical protein [Flammeovirga sp. OC4]
MGTKVTSAFLHSKVGVEIKTKIEFNANSRSMKVSDYIRYLVENDDIISFLKQKIEKESELKKLTEQSRV